MAITPRFSEQTEQAVLSRLLTAISDEIDTTRLIGIRLNRSGGAVACVYRVRFSVKLRV